MDWSKVGSYLKDNVGKELGLVGSLVTGNVPGALAAGISMIQSATGSSTPDGALAELKGNPDAIVKLKQIAAQEADSIRKHMETMNLQELQDKQAEQHETQATIRNGDNSQYAFVRFTRPAQSWASLLACFVYIAEASTVNIQVVFALLTLPWAYAGLRQVGKGITSMAQAAVGKAQAQGKP